jgi:hypothetical protein
VQEAGAEAREDERMEKCYYDYLCDLDDPALLQEGLYIHALFVKAFLIYKYIPLYRQPQGFWVLQFPSSDMSSSVY